MPLNKDAYLLWKDNEVTRSFLNEMREGLQSHVENHGFGKNLEEIGMNALIRKAKIEILEKVLEWKPEEVEDDSND
mgnify:FL=1